jgi:hypothetical protein
MIEEVIVFYFCSSQHVASLSFSSSYLYLLLFLMSAVSKCRIARSLYLANPSMPWKGNQYALNVWVLKKMRKTKTWILCKWNGWFLPLPSVMPSPCLPQLYKKSSTEIKKVPCLLHMLVLSRILFCVSTALKDNISFVVLL